MPSADAGLKEQLSRVPESPGVYLWKDAAGAVLYVGKAKALRRRMRQYVNGADEREKIPVMMEQVASFDYVVTDSEVESLILEANLIKQFCPPYNVGYRDDKSYPFIALSMSDPFPAIKFTRERHRAGARYFGPFTDARAARETIDVVRRIWPVCAASCVEWKRLTAHGGQATGKACFDYQVGKGPGPCVGAVTREQYMVNVAKVTAFLDGKQSGVVADLESRMRAAASELDFERAARLRNALEAVRAIRQRQRIVSLRPLDADVIGFEREETIAAAHVFIVREGRVLAGNEFVLDKGLDTPIGELVEGFLLRYYGSATHIPAEVLVADMPLSPDAVGEWLARLRSRKVSLAVPQRGEKRRLIELAGMNARHSLLRYKFRTRYDEGRLNTALLQLESALSLPAPPMRIEAYDISTIHGRHSVGSMIVFTDGRPDSSQYRRFKVRLETGESNDVAMMAEVVKRRFMRQAREGGRFAKKPDLLLVDGGRPQVSAVGTVLAELDAGEIPLAGLAKRDEEVFVAGQADPIILPSGSAALYLIKRVRDEAHRFAIEYHRKVRGRAMTASALDDVPGVGPKRRLALVRAFGSVKRLQQASLDEIVAVKGMTRPVAEDVWSLLNDGNSPASDA